MAQVWQLGNFGTDAKLNPLEVLVLMLTMTANELPTVINNMFRYICNMKSAQRLLQIPADDKGFRPSSCTCVTTALQ